MDTIITALFVVAITIVSAVFHELAHGAVADWMGDPTPGLAGRLTLNPLVHLEWIGSLLLPLVCVLSGTGFIIGWAKPVPFNPKYFRNERWGTALVAAAGPVTNLLLAAIAAIAFRIISTHPTTTLVSLATLIGYIVLINLSLAVFNLIPIPPLDGHHILGACIPRFREWSHRVMSKYGLILLVIVLFFAGSIIAPVVSFLAKLFIG